MPFHLGPRWGYRGYLRLPSYLQYSGTSGSGGEIEAISNALHTYSGTSGSSGEVKAEAASTPGGGIEAISIVLHTYNGTSGPGREIEAASLALVILSALAQAEN